MRYSKWYVIVWHLLWGVPVYVTRALFVGAIFAGWGSESARQAWKATR